MTLTPADALGPPVGVPGRADPSPPYEIARGADPDRYVVVGYAEADAVLRDPGFAVEDMIGATARVPGRPRPVIRRMVG